MKNKPNLAIVGATGLVGLTILKVLEEENLEFENIFLFASKKSRGKLLKFQGKNLEVEVLNEKSFNREIDVALFVSNKDVSKVFIPLALRKGIKVIDNSSFYRNDPNIPLIVSGVNDNLITKDDYIISNPNCSTIQSILALHKINEKYKIKRIVYSTYQAVSGSGYNGVLDLLNTEEGKPNKFYSDPIANNLIPSIGDIGLDGYSLEELKMINETKRIFMDPNLEVTATCVRVPVVNSHSISINIECEKKIDLKELISELKLLEYLSIYENDYPTPRLVSGSNLVHIGRLRADKSVENGMNLWVVADNLRVGAATNAVRILKKLLKGDSYDL